MCRLLLLLVFCLGHPVWAGTPGGADIVEAHVPLVTSVDPVEIVSKRFEEGELTLIELGSLLQDKVNDGESLLSPGFSNLFGLLMFGNDAEGCVMVKALSDEAKRKLDLRKVIAYQGSPVCYQQFKQQGVPWPESAKELGIGPLHVAVKFNNRRMVKWLIQQNPDSLNRQDKEGRRPLLYSQDDAMVKFLLEHGATPPEEWDK